MHHELSLGPDPICGRLHARSDDGLVRPGIGRVVQHDSGRLLCHRYRSRRRTYAGRGRHMHAWCGSIGGRGVGRGFAVVPGRPAGCARACMHRQRHACMLLRTHRDFFKHAYLLPIVLARAATNLFSRELERTKTFDRRTYKCSRALLVLDRRRRKFSKPRKIIYIYI